MAEFKVGDVVRLKSHGPQMTVTDPKNEFGSVEATWFNNEGNTYTIAYAAFKPETLDKVR